MAYYKVEMTYPNGRVEEIEEDFETKQAAFEYGKSLLGQVSYNARFHEEEEDEFGNNKTVDPFFVIEEMTSEGRKIVFSSK